MRLKRVRDYATARQVATSMSLFGELGFCKTKVGRVCHFGRRV